MCGSGPSAHMAVMSKELPPDRRDLRGRHPYPLAGPAGLSRPFDGEHELCVVATDPRTSRFTQREAFRGVLVPLLGRILDDTEAGFAAMNAALDARATSLVARASTTTG